MSYLFEVHGATFKGIATAEPLGPQKQIRAIDAGNVTFLFTDLLPTTGEAVGTGDAIETEFTLDNFPVHPLSETIYVNAVAQVRGTDYTIVDATGAISFTVAPGNTLAITADYYGDTDSTLLIAMVAAEAFDVGGNCTGVTSVGNILIS